MKKLISYIVPMSSGIIGSNNAHGEFILVAGSFYISLKRDLRSAVMLPYSSDSLEHFSFYEDGVYIVKRGSGWFAIKDGKFLPFHDMSFLENINSQQVGDYKITNVDVAGGFEVFNKKTEKRLKFEGRRHYFRAYYKDHFYIEKGKIPKEIKCFDSDLRLVKSYGFGGQGFRGAKSFDKFLFYTVRDNNGDVLEIFDLDKFEPVARSKKNVTKQWLDFYAFNNIFYLFIGKDLYLWDGITLRCHEVGGAIREHLVKDEFIYMIFEGDYNLYALRLSDLEVVKKKRMSSDSYYLGRLSKSGHYTACLTCKNEMFTDGIRCFSVWHDDDFFSDEEWDVVIEQPIYKEVQVKDGENFRVEIYIGAACDYITVARQSMAILEDVLQRHSVLMVPSASDQSFSETFNGKVLLSFQDSSHLNVEQRESLASASKDMAHRFEVACRGFANGDPQPIQLSINFIS